MLEKYTLNLGPVTIVLVKYSTVVKVVTPPTLGLELPSKGESLPSVVPKLVPGPPGKRSPANIAVLGEINLVEAEGSLSFVDDIIIACAN